MAVGTGAGALNVTKPITVNDMMEAIALPGLKPEGGYEIDASSLPSAKTTITTVGGAGYTEVIDDIIVEVTEQTAVEMILKVGYLEPDPTDTETDDDDYFLTVTIASGTTPQLYSVLRNNMPGSATWGSTADHVNERTFGPGATDADGDAVTDRNKMSNVNVSCTGGAALGVIRVWIRSHYTAVNFGPGL